MALPDSPKQRARCPRRSKVIDILKVYLHNLTCMRCVVRHNTKIRNDRIICCAVQHILCRMTKFSPKSVGLCKYPIYYVRLGHVRLG
jgi:hypothetical protein